jgi:hypothetical protein
MRFFSKIFKKKYSVTIMDESWKPLKTIVKLENIPRIDELIFLETQEIYYKVTSVIHYLNDNHGIFIIVTKYSEEKKF